MEDIDKLLLNFLNEDIGEIDITSNILPKSIIDAYIICKEDAIIAGIDESIRIFELVNCKAIALVNDGDKVKKDNKILSIRGYAYQILSAERTVLNILMRMSGIATLTRAYIDVIKDINPKIRIAGTRKTAPGLRYFDKKAVRIGNGYTHRYKLDEMVLLKDNHLAILGSITKGIKLAKEYYGDKYAIEVEVRTLNEAIEAIENNANIIMLDNLRADEVYDIVSTLKSKGLRDKVKIEVSGGINMSNIRDYAKADIDIISIGALTHSVKAIDLSLEVKL